LSSASPRVSEGPDLPRRVRRWIPISRKWCGQPFGADAIALILIPGIRVRGQPDTPGKKALAGLAVRRWVDAEDLARARRRGRKLIVIRDETGARLLRSESGELMLPIDNTAGVEGFENPAPCAPADPPRGSCLEALVANSLSARVLFANAFVDDGRRAQRRQLRHQADDVPDRGRHDLQALRRGSAGRRRGGVKAARQRDDPSGAYVFARICFGGVGR
jgi:hypothetical protein